MSAVVVLKILNIDTKKYYQCILPIQFPDNFLPLFQTLSKDCLFVLCWCLINM
jgi:hypothetical protein